MIRKYVLSKPHKPAPETDPGAAPGEGESGTPSVEADCPLSHDDPPAAGVGYKKPPARSRFTKGKSGNAKGRPRGSRSLRTELREVLEAKIAVTENGKKTLISARHAMLLRQRQKAIGGDQRSSDGLLRLAMSLLPDETPVDAASTEADAKLLEEILADMRREANGGDDE